MSEQIDVQLYRLPTMESLGLYGIWRGQEHLATLEAASKEDALEKYLTSIQIDSKK